MRNLACMIPANSWLLFALLVSSSLGVVAAATPSPNPAPAVAKPNIVFILADDLGYGDLGCYGQKKFATPSLDRMAAEGLKFTQFYSGAAVCAPSRCTLLTGLSTGHAPVRGNKEVLPEGQVAMPSGTLTVARLLKQAGYETALIGKWGLGYPGSGSEPLQAGFDYFFGYNCQRYAHWYYPESLWRNREKVPLPANREDKRGTYTHDLFEAEALKYITAHQQKPFFLYLAVTIPHAELLVPEDSIAAYRGKWPEKPFSGNNAGAAGSTVGAYHDSPTPRAAFAGMVNRLDRTVGHILNELKRLQLSERTLVIFTSDNGPHKEGGADPEFFDSNGPLRGYKRDLYEGGIRVPFLAWWPGHIQAGRTTDHLGYFGDFFATAADLSGQRAPVGLDSISFLPTLLGQSRQISHEYLAWESYEGAGARAVRWGNWKAVRPKWNAPIELYDLSRDLGEQKDVAARFPNQIEKASMWMDQAHQHSELWPEPIGGNPTH